MKKVVCFGEILIDEFPTGKVIGGAPLNVAVWTSKLGNQSYLISAVGEDQNANELLSFLEQTNVNCDLIQQQSEFPSGYVSVILDEKGVAIYTIHQPVAWDKIELTEKMLQVVSDSDAFLYSTLPARDPQNQAVIQTLLSKANYKIFDANLRPPHYSLEQLQSFCEQADLIKVNEEELKIIGNIYQITKNSIQEIAKAIADITDTPTICVTLGEKGATVFHNNHFYEHEGYKVEVQDTVGAGDAFLAAFISNLLQQKSVEECLQQGCLFGAFVSTQQGGSTGTSLDIIYQFHRKMTLSY